MYKFFPVEMVYFNIPYYIMNTTPSFFKKAATDPDSMGEKFVGPNYVYSKFIKSPTEMGMSGEGTMDALSKNVAGLMNYMQILTEGGGKASKTGGILGDRFFITTGGKCTDASNNSVTRSMYIDNVANGNSQALQKLGMGDTAFNGLIPGILNDATAMNPVAIFGAFAAGSQPKCRNIHMKTSSANNKAGTGAGFVVDSEIKSINPCAFVNGINPLSNEKCTIKESFVNANMKIKKGMKRNPYSEISFKNKPLANVYTTAIGGLMVYILYKLMYGKSN
jgi:hypothetical protein